VSRFSIGVLIAVVGVVQAQEARSPKPGITVALSCNRQSVLAADAFPIKLVVTNDGGGAPLKFDRNELIHAKALVGSGYDRKGQWMTVPEPPAAGAVELRAGESFSMEARVKFPEALTRQGGGLLVEWVGSGPLEGLRSNQVTLTIRPDQNPVATLETSEGVIVFELWPDKAPNHVANFITLAKSGFYDGRIFHRVIPSFMIQTGSTVGSRAGEPGYKIAAEINDAQFLKGTVGMARLDGQMDSADSQFFICVADTRALDSQYTAFGRVIEGQEVADKISQAPRDPQKGDRPFNEVRLKRLTVSTPAGYTLPEVKKVTPEAESRPESRPESR
jgi:peptidyl-prolyl cis-trans isomerase B (cyclophilin B)